MLILALVVVGYVGLFFGRWIKAAVSRQREYLADASAVQFTRDPQGIAGALKKIAIQAGGSWMIADTEEARKQLDNLALAARVKAALRRSSETRSGKLEVSCDDGEVTLIGDPGSTEEKLAAVEIAVTVPGVRDIHVGTRA